MKVETLDEVYALAFAAVQTAETYRDQIQYGPNNAFEKFWREHPELGAPATPDIEVTSTGQVVRIFLPGRILEWLGGNDVQYLR